MIRVQRRTYTLIAWPWRVMSWAQAPEGLEFTLYDVVQPVVRGVEVPGSPQDAARWKVAHDACQDLLRHAEDVVRHAHGVRCKPGFMADHRTVRLRRYGLMPGRKARSRRLFAECETRMRAAEEAYRPILDEIESRLARTPADPA
ncbi:hypothetical protein P3T27_002382 [Kitasatospora sp. MAA19]|uniref:hypothetical protein n=1 Tax=Kitasatospora sp. MAA19 TaxID=3035090 RepID=UPI0024740892|nr:hypothetical protein [Kitasatospora sp. MAA19]MDH6705660.1 hypothetical protein [Kitasatospora sp. MAA19]